MSTIELSNETVRLVIDPTQGCRIDSLEICKPGGGWSHVLRSGADGAGSFLMVPWTNRIKEGRFGFEGADYQLESNHPDGSAIHGVGRDHVWAIADRSPYTGRFVFDSRLVDGVNFPFAFGAEFRVEIGDGTVEVDLDLTNLGDGPMPGGVGHHPYFLRSLWDERDDLRIKAGVAGRYPCENQIPVGAMVDDEMCQGMRAGWAVGNPGLDDVFGGFNGKAFVEWDKSGVHCEMECSVAFGHLVVYTPKNAQGAAPLPWVCVEPLTMVNDGFNRRAKHTDTGVQVLEAGEMLRSSMSLRFERV